LKTANHNASFLPCVHPILYGTVQLLLYGCYRMVGCSWISTL